MWKSSRVESDRDVLPKYVAESSRLFACRLLFLRGHEDTQASGGHADSGWAELWINGQKYGNTYLGRTLTQLEYPRFASVQVGMGTSASPGIVYFDDAFLSTDRIAP